MLSVSHTARRLCVCLHKLDMSLCQELDNVRFVSSLVRLRTLDLSDCSEQLVDVSPLSSLTSLTALYLNFTRSGVRRRGHLADVSPLSVLVTLQTLHLAGCEQLNVLSPLSTLTSLISLDMSRCDQLNSVSPLSSLNSLTNLNLSNSYHMSDMSPLSVLTRLTSLYLGECYQLSNISLLSTLTSLSSLNLGGSNELHDLSPLSSLITLTSLELYMYDQLSDVSPVSSLTSLTSLKLRGYDHLSDGRDNELTPITALTTPSATQAHFLQMAHSTRTALITDPVSDSAFQSALAYVVKRHDSLRTHFMRSTDISASAVVDTPESAPTTVTFESAASLAEAASYATKFSKIRFDLVSGPLVRFLPCSAGNRRLLVVSAHHAVVDGASLSIVLSEIHLAYSAIVGETALKLPAAMQYSEHATRQQAWLERDVGKQREAQLTYWRGVIADAPAVFDIPTDHPRPPHQSFEVASIGFALSASLVERLTATGAAANATLFMTVLSVFKLLLSRYGRTDDLVIAVQVAGRGQQGTDGLVGCLFNKVALKLGNSRDDTVGDLLGRVRQTVMGDSSTGGHWTEDFDTLQTEGINYELEAAFAPSSDGLRCELRYATKIFERSTVERMVRRFELMQECVAGGEAVMEVPVSAVRMMDGKEEAAVLTSFCGERKEFPSQLPLVSARAQASPDCIASKQDGQTITYKELDASSSALGRRLVAQHGVQVNDAVGLCADRSHGMLIAMLGVLTAGAGYVPLDPFQSGARLGALLAESRLTVAISVGRCSEIMDALSVSTHVLKKLVSLSGAMLALTSAHPRSLAAGRSLELPNAAVMGEVTVVLVAAPPFAVTAGHQGAAYPMCTSGSTGMPKGCNGSNHGLVNRCTWLNRIAQYDPHDVCCARTPLSFIDAVTELLAPLSAGGRIELMPAATTITLLLSDMSSRRMTRLAMVSVLLRLLQEAIEELRQTLYLQVVVVSGDRLLECVAARFRTLVPGCRLLNMYGCTEVVGDVTWHDATNAGGKAAAGVPIGNANDGVSVEIVGTNLRPVSPGTAGEILVRGRCVSSGYAGASVLKDKAHVLSEHWGGLVFRTGDRGREDAASNIEYMGRLDRQLELHGQRVEPGEIEAVIVDNTPAIECVVPAREAGRGARRLQLVAFMSPAGIGVDELLSQCQPGLLLFMVPAMVQAVAQWPSTSTGKIDKNKLLLLTPSASTQASATAPRNHVEVAVQALWPSLLVVDLSAIDVHDDFFGLGGNSILAMLMASALRLQFLGSAPITISAVFTGPIISEIAHVLASLAPEPSHAPPSLPMTKGLVADDEPVPVSFNQEQIQHVFACGETLPPGVCQRFFKQRSGATLAHGYCNSESTLVEYLLGNIEFMRGQIEEHNVIEAEMTSLCEAISSKREDSKDEFCVENEDLSMRKQLIVIMENMTLDDCSIAHEEDMTRILTFESHRVFEVQKRLLEIVLRKLMKKNVDHKGSTVILSQKTIVKRIKKTYGNVFPKKLISRTLRVGKYFKPESRVAGSGNSESTLWCKGLPFQRPCEQTDAHRCDSSTIPIKSKTVRVQRVRRASVRVSTKIAKQAKAKRVYKGISNSEWAELRNLAQGTSLVAKTTRCAEKDTMTRNETISQKPSSPKKDGTLVPKNIRSLAMLNMRLIKNQAGLLCVEVKSLDGVAGVTEHSVMIRTVRPYGGESDWMPAGPKFLGDSIHISKAPQGEALSKIRSRVSHDGLAGPWLYMYDAQKHLAQLQRDKGGEVYEKPIETRQDPLSPNRPVCVQDCETQDLDAAFVCWVGQTLVVQSRGMRGGCRIRRETSVNWSTYSFPTNGPLVLPGLDMNLVYEVHVSHDLDFKTSAQSRVLSVAAPKKVGRSENTIEVMEFTSEDASAHDNHSNLIRIEVMNGGISGIGQGQILDVREVGRCQISSSNDSNAFHEIIKALGYLSSTGEFPSNSCDVLVVLDIIVRLSIVPLHDLVELTQKSNSKLRQLLQRKLLVNEKGSIAETLNDVLRTIPGKHRQFSIVTLCVDDTTGEWHSTGNLGSLCPNLSGGLTAYVLFMNYHFVQLVPSVGAPVLTCPPCHVIGQSIDNHLAVELPSGEIAQVALSAGRIDIGSLTELCQLFLQQILVNPQIIRDGITPVSSIAHSDHVLRLISSPNGGMMNQVTSIPKKYGTIKQRVGHGQSAYVFALTNNEFVVKVMRDCAAFGREVENLKKVLGITHTCQLVIHGEGFSRAEEQALGEVYSGDNPPKYWMVLTSVGKETCQSWATRERHCVQLWAKRVTNFTNALLDILTQLERCEAHHNDMHPQNIMVSNGQPVLIDFGAMTTGTPRAGGDLMFVAALVLFLIVGGSFTRPSAMKPELFERLRGFVVTKPNHKHWVPLLNRAFQSNPGEHFKSVDDMKISIRQLSVDDDKLPSQLDAVQSTGSAHHTDIVIRQLLYFILHKFSELCKHLKIPYSIICGSLLGAVRHKSMIPWDDDIDVGIPEYHFDFGRWGEQLDLLNSHLPKCGLKIVDTGLLYKICFKDLPNIPTKQYSFPSLDIFTLRRTMIGWEYSNARAKQLWPKAYWKLDEIFVPLEPNNKRQKVQVGQSVAPSSGDPAVAQPEYITQFYKFGNLRVCGPVKSRAYLMRLYGQDCLSHAHTRLWDHQTESRTREKVTQITNFQPDLILVPKAVDAELIISTLPLHPTQQVPANIHEMFQEVCRGNKSSGAFDPNKFVSGTFSGELDSLGSKEFLAMMLERSSKKHVQLEKEEAKIELSASQKAAVKEILAEPNLTTEELSKIIARISGDPEEIVLGIRLHELGNVELDPDTDSCVGQRGGIAHIVRTMPNLIVPDNIRLSVVLLCNGSVSAEAQKEAADKMLLKTENRLPKNVRLIFYETRGFVDEADLNVKLAQLWNMIPFISARDFPNFFACTNLDASDCITLNEVWLRIYMSTLLAIHQQETGHVFLLDATNLVYMERRCEYHLAGNGLLRPKDLGNAAHLAPSRAKDIGWVFNSMILPRSTVSLLLRNAYGSAPKKFRLSVSHTASEDVLLCENLVRLGCSPHLTNSHLTQKQYDSRAKNEKLTWDLKKLAKIARAHPVSVCIAMGRLFCASGATWFGATRSLCKYHIREANGKTVRELFLDAPIPFLKNNHVQKELRELPYPSLFAELRKYFDKLPALANIQQRSSKTVKRRDPDINISLLVDKNTQNTGHYNHTTVSTCGCNVCIVRTRITRTRLLVYPMIRVFERLKRGLQSLSRIMDNKENLHESMSNQSLLGWLREMKVVLSMSAHGKKGQFGVCLVGAKNDRVKDVPINVYCCLVTEDDGVKDMKLLFSLSKTQTSLNTKSHLLEHGLNNKHKRLSKCKRDHQMKSTEMKKLFEHILHPASTTTPTTSTTPPSTAVTSPAIPVYVLHHGSRGQHPYQFFASTVENLECNDKIPNMYDVIKKLRLGEDDNVIASILGACTESNMTLENCVYAGSVNGVSGRRGMNTPNEGKGDDVESKVTRSAGRNGSFHFPMFVDEVLASQRQIIDDSPITKMTVRMLRMLNPTSGPRTFAQIDRNIQTRIVLLPTAIRQGTVDNKFNVETDIPGLIVKIGDNDVHKLFTKTKGTRLIEIRFNTGSVKCKPMRPSRYESQQITFKPEFTRSNYYTPLATDEDIDNRNVPDASGLLTPSIQEEKDTHPPTGTQNSDVDSFVERMLGPHKCKNDVKIKAGIYVAIEPTSNPIMASQLGERVAPEKKTCDACDQIASSSSNSTGNKNTVHHEVVDGKLTGFCGDCAPSKDEYWLNLFRTAQTYRSAQLFATRVLLDRVFPKISQTVLALNRGQHDPESAVSLASASNEISTAIANQLTLRLSQDKNANVRSSSVQLTDYISVYNMFIKAVESAVLHGDTNDQKCKRMDLIMTVAFGQFQKANKDGVRLLLCIFIIHTVMREEGLDAGTVISHIYNIQQTVSESDSSSDSEDNDHEGDDWISSDLLIVHSDLDDDEIMNTDKSAIVCKQDDGKVYTVELSSMNMFAATRLLLEEWLKEQPETEDQPERELKANELDEFLSSLASLSGDNNESESSSDIFQFVIQEETPIRKSRETEDQFFLRYSREVLRTYIGKDKTQNIAKNKIKRSSKLKDDQVPNANLKDDGSEMTFLVAFQGLSRQLDINKFVEMTSRESSSTTQEVEELKFTITTIDGNGKRTQEEKAFAMPLGSDEAIATKCVLAHCYPTTQLVGVSVSGKRDEDTFEQTAKSLFSIFKYFCRIDKSRIDESKTREKSSEIVTDQRQKTLIFKLDGKELWRSEKSKEGFEEKSQQDALDEEDDEDRDRKEADTLINVARLLLCSVAWKLTTGPSRDKTPKSCQHQKKTCGGRCICAQGGRECNEKCECNMHLENNCRFKGITGAHPCATQCKCTCENMNSGYVSAPREGWCPDALVIVSKVKASRAERRTIRMKHSDWIHAHHAEAVARKQTVDQSDRTAIINALIERKLESIGDLQELKSRLLTAGYVCPPEKYVDPKASARALTLWNTSLRAIFENLKIYDLKARDTFDPVGQSLKGKLTNEQAQDINHDQLQNIMKGYDTRISSGKLKHSVLIRCPTSGPEKVLCWVPTMHTQVQQNGSRVQLPLRLENVTLHVEGVGKQSYKSIIMPKRDGSRTVIEGVSIRGFNGVSDDKYFKFARPWRDFKFDLAMQRLVLTQGTLRWDRVTKLTLHLPLSEPTSTQCSHETKRSIQSPEMAQTKPYSKVKLHKNCTWRCLQDCSWCLNTNSKKRKVCGPAVLETSTTNDEHSPSEDSKMSSSGTHEVQREEVVPGTKTAFKYEPGFMWPGAAKLDSGLMKHVNMKRGTVNDTGFEWVAAVDLGLKCYAVIEVLNTGAIYRIGDGCHRRMAHEFDRPIRKLQKEMAELANNEQLVVDKHDLFHSAQRKHAESTNLACSKKTLKKVKDARRAYYDAVTAANALLWADASSGYAKKKQKIHILKRKKDKFTSLLAKVTSKFMSSMGKDGRVLLPTNLLDQKSKKSGFLNGPVNDMRFGLLRKKLKFDCARTGCMLVEVREDRTSKWCHCCGKYNGNLGGGRTFKCGNSKCLITCDRDEGAAKHIILLYLIRRCQWDEPVVFGDLLQRTRNIPKLVKEANNSLTHYTHLFLAFSLSLLISTTMFHSYSLDLLGSLPFSFSLSLNLFLSLLLFRSQPEERRKKTCFKVDLN